MEKIRQNTENQKSNNDSNIDNTANANNAQDGFSQPNIPPKVAEVYTQVGKILHHYKSGKLPKG